MTKPRHLWTAFAASVLLVAAAMTWLSLTALESERAEIDGQRTATLEENVRLSLWRMNAKLSGFIARESSHAHFVYSTFYPAEGAWNGMFQEIPTDKVLVPSPLLTTANPSHVLGYFNCAPSGEITSPQAPTGNMQDLAEKCLVEPQQIEKARTHLLRLCGTVTQEKLETALGVTDANFVGQSFENGTPFVFNGSNQLDLQQNLRQQVTRNSHEWTSRVRAAGNAKANPQQTMSTVTSPTVDPRPPVTQEPIQPLWVDDMLLLARRVRHGDLVTIQGCELDWTSIRPWLLDEVSDLLPEADLVPVRGTWDQEEVGRTLVSLPARLIPGDVPFVYDFELTSTQKTLLVSWICVGTAVLLCGFVLRRAVALSERRGAFVSAVTHELRTPLTTFKLYTDMLATGRVTDEAKKSRYLTTLRTEADRLGHLVENVLGYSQLERGRAAAVTERLTVDDLVCRVGSRPEQRVAQAEMTWVTSVPGDVAEAFVETDVGAVEQIVFNLVDNACKYAGRAADRRVHLDVEPSDRHLLIHVRDHGPGIASDVAKRLFRPFSKSVDEAARSAPGVGLGLAFSRRLARQLGGDLVVDCEPTQGCRFTLSLPFDLGRA